MDMVIINLLPLGSFFLFFNVQSPSKWLHIMLVVAIAFMVLIFKRLSLG